jgi:hypothetical protein
MTSILKKAIAIRYTLAFRAQKRDNITNISRTRIIPHAFAKARNDAGSLFLGKKEGWHNSCTDFQKDQKLA